MKCLRCGVDTPRLTLAQIHCPPCQREVDAIIEADARRHSAVGRPAWLRAAKVLDHGMAPR